ISPSGTLIDRFDDVNGISVAPAGGPYMQRTLPPINLDYNPGDLKQASYNYHVYVFTKELIVAGPVTLWFLRSVFGT
ncbi:hypothetical protein CC78DRAFT_478197, partial [Lojkania enalia]